MNKFCEVDMRWGPCGKVANHILPGVAGYEDMPLCDDHNVECDMLENALKADPVFAERFKEEVDKAYKESLN